MAELSIDNLLYGYSNGIFPMADGESKEIYWYSPDPRAIIPLEGYRPSKSLRPVLNQKRFEVFINKNFEGTIRCCAQPRFAADETWISEAFIEAYTQMHDLGWAHSVECYFEGRLVGGLYGVAIGGVFFGESMFHLLPNASKVAFHYLIEILKKQGFVLLDTQFINDNVKRFGAIEISKADFLERLGDGLCLERHFALC
jgi:leucyl/phenylalanyl-tRNA---protein transferase